MAAVSPIDLATLGVRLVFVALLYLVVAAVLLSLRSGLREEPRRPRRAVRRAALALIDAAPHDGPVGRTIELAHPLVIGRRAPSDLVLRDDAVSARHARIAGAEGEWQIEDLGSTNGTFLNGRRISAPAVLHPGDVITVGNASWRFDVQEA